MFSEIDAMDLRACRRRIARVRRVGSVPVEERTAIVSEQAGADHRPLHSGDRHGHPRAHSRAEAVGTLGATGRRRQPPGREWQHRHRHGRQGGAGWLHLADHREHAGDDGEPVSQRTLRSDQGLGSGREDGDGNDGGHAQSRGPRALAQGIRRLCQGQPGQGGVRFARCRNAAAPRHGALQVDDGHRHAACSV